MAGPGMDFCAFVPRGLLVCLALVWTQALRADPVMQPDGTQRPRVALVLSGGGARGLAHIGVLKVLHELRVPVDLVVGTSMGAVVGGAFASGRTPEALERLFADTDWERVLADRPPRDELAFRRRDEDKQLPSRLEFGLGRDGLTLPPAAAGNAALERALARLLPEGAHDQPSSRLPLPFRSVASDLLSGELVELKDTSLLQALRASLSLPGVFAPVRVDGRLLVDGGLVRNLPVDLAHAMGADIVIAVNVGTPLSGEEALGSSLGVAQQMLNILTEQNVQRSMQALRPTDLLIAPRLQGLGILDFAAQTRAVQAGADATRAVLPRLQALALSPAAYAAWDAARAGPAAAPPVALPLARLQVQGQDRIAAAALMEQSGLREGSPVTPDDVRDAASRLYGRGDIQRVQAEISDDAGQRSVLLRVSEAPWARSRLRLGLELASDFSDNTSFAVAAMHVASSLNAWGAELRTTARVGSRRSVGVEWWQPLGAGARWYLLPTLDYEAGPEDIYSDGLRVGRASFRATRLGLSAGRQLGDWGDLRLGYERALASARLIVPETLSQQGRYRQNQWFVRFQVDTLDSINFPTRGQLVDAVWQRPVLEAGADTVNRFQVATLVALGRGGLAGHVYGEWSRATSGLAPRTLGGFLRLSGTPQGSVDGQTVALGRLVLAQRVAQLPAPYGGAVRVGFSLEVGGAFALADALRPASLKRAGSLFLAAETRFGPIYLGAGGTQGGNGTVYLFLGPIW